MKQYVLTATQRLVMLRRILPVLVALLFLVLTPAHAAEVSPDSSFLITVPDGWESLGTGSVSQAPQAVVKAIDCANEDPGDVKLLGWKLSSGGEFEAAYCISYQRRGMGKLRQIIKSSSGADRKKASDKFIDTFASKLNEEYSIKRKMTLSDLSADLMTADNDVVLVMDGKLKGQGRELLRSLVVYLHDDGLLNISFIYDVNAPLHVSRALDVLPISVKWQ